jgi:hypothetical protein
MKVGAWLTDKSFNLFQHSLAPHSLAGINPGVACSAPGLLNMQRRNPAKVKPTLK